jgi:hypothetical protein
MSWKICQHRSLADETFVRIMIARRLDGSGQAIRSPVVVQVCWTSPHGLDTRCASFNREVLERRCGKVRVRCSVDERMRRVDSQAIKAYKLCNAAEYHKHSNGKVDHATIAALV